MSGTPTRRPICLPGAFARPLAADWDRALPLHARAAVRSQSSLSSRAAEISDATDAFASTRRAACQCPVITDLSKRAWDCSSSSRSGTVQPWSRPQCPYGVVSVTDLGRVESGSAYVPAPVMIQTDRRTMLPPDKRLPG
jgi:hypothetical protein